MTVDVEDYFQVRAYEPYVPRPSWDAWPPRVEANTHRLLDLFAAHGARATFFTLGWVAERFPGLVRRIVEEGHELASHGFWHRSVHGQSPASFREDVRRAKRVLEDRAGVEVRGYRAPNFSIGHRTRWAYAILGEEGYRYSSSRHPAFRRHGPGEGAIFRPVAGGVPELPLPTVSFFGLGLPFAGGAWFRILPGAWTDFGFVRATRRRMPVVFYLHPWEIDPDQPALPASSFDRRLRHRTGLGRVLPRLERLLRSFSWDRIDRWLESEAGQIRPSAAGSL